MRTPASAGGLRVAAMIRLRQTIERGTRHRWLGLLFVVVLCMMLALLFLHGLHDSDHATELREFCVGLVIMFSLLIVDPDRPPADASRGACKPGDLVFRGLGQMGMYVGRRQLRSRASYRRRRQELLDLRGPPHLELGRSETGSATSNDIPPAGI
jgi:hypothetical protein